MIAGSSRERHIGIVTDNNDDEKRGRIKVACSTLMGVDDSGGPIEYPVWIEPSFPHLLVGAEAGEGVADSGFFFVPNVGVAVEFEITVSGPADKSTGQSSIGNPDPRWVSSVLLPGDALNSDFTTNYPNRMGWRSVKGSILMFDDTDGQERAVFRGPSNADGLHSYVSIEPDGSMIIATNLAHLIHLNDQGEITIIDSHGNTIATDEGGLKLISHNGSLITVGADVQVLSGGNVTVNASNVSLNAAAVELGGMAVEAIIKGNTFQALFNAHTHQFVGNIGIPGVTLPPLVPLVGAELSLVSKTE